MVTVSIVKASLRAVFRGGSFVDGGVRDRGAVSAVAMPPAVCGGRLAARGYGEKLVSLHTKGLCSGEM